jgi:hypothetical protein
LDEVEELLCEALHRLINNPSLIKSLTNYSWLNTLCLTSN